MVLDLVGVAGLVGFAGFAGFVGFVGWVGLEWPGLLGWMSFDTLSWGRRCLLIVAPRSVGSSNCRRAAMLSCAKG